MIIEKFCSSVSFSVMRYFVLPYVLGTFSFALKYAKQHLDFQKGSLRHGWRNCNVRINLFGKKVLTKWYSISIIINASRKDAEK